MKYNLDIHHRRSIRLKEYDYSQAGAYFVTICTHRGECVFGEIKEGRMMLNKVGRMIEKWWWELKNKFTEIELDEYMIMPNHFHGIIMLVGADLCVSPNDPKGEHIGSPLPKIVQWFKTMTTNEYIHGVKRNIYAQINKRLWQRNYYEHIIRNEDDLKQVREYVLYNPLKWELDEENPENMKGS